MKTELSLEEKKAEIRKQREKTEQKKRLMQLRKDEITWKEKLSTLQAQELMVIPKNTNRLMKITQKIRDIRRQIRELEQIVDGA